jgi:hypothetical protein
MPNAKTGLPAGEPPIPKPRQLGTSSNVLESWLKTIEASILAIEEQLGLTMLQEVSSRKIVRFSDLCVFLLRDSRQFEKLPPKEYKTVCVAAQYLVLSILPSHLKAVLSLLRGHFPYQAAVLLRTTTEALDLTGYLRSPRCDVSRDWDWLHGKVISNKETRRASKFMFHSGGFLIDKELKDWEQQMLTEKLGTKTLSEAYRRLKYRGASSFAHHSATHIAEMHEPEGRRKIAEYVLEELASCVIRATWETQSLLEHFVSKDQKQKRFERRITRLMRRALFKRMDYGELAEAYNKTTRFPSILSKND